MTCELCTKYVAGSHFCTKCGISVVRANVFRTTDRMRARPLPPPKKRLSGTPVYLAIVVVGGLIAHRHIPWESLGSTVDTTKEAVEESKELATGGVSRGLAVKEMEMLLRMVEYHYVSTQKWPTDMESFAAAHLRLPPGRTPGRDPYGNVYVVTPLPGEGAFELRSPGPDQKVKTADDIVMERR